MGSLLLAVLISIGCSRPQPELAGVGSAAERDAALRQVAAEYARDSDLVKAQAELDKLKLANPAQLLVSIAEQDASAGRPAEEVAPLARLADALGARSPKLVAYLEPTTATAPVATTGAPTEPSTTSLPATATAIPSDTPVPVSPTSASTATPMPPTASPTPQQPRVHADSSVNVRGGPGTAYPIVGQLKADQEVDIIGRNASGDWWQITWGGQGQAWVAGVVVNVLGPIDTVAQTRNIPPPPPTSTPAPPPPPSATPKPAGAEFQLAGRRLWGALENGGSFDGPSFHCGLGRVLHAIVIDGAGNRLNGITVRSATAPYEERVTGSKGPGIAEFDLREAKEVYVIRDEAGREVSSDHAYVTTMVYDIPVQSLIEGGYCKDSADCALFVQQCSCCHHYSWDVVFRR